MIGARVIGNLILNDLDAELMGLINQLTKFRKRPKVFFHTVKIDSAITMIISYPALWSTGTIGILLAFIKMIDIVVPRRQPNRRHAEFLQVRQVPNDPFKVTAVVVTSL